MIRPKSKRLLDPERLTKPIKERLDTEGFALPKSLPSVPQQPKDGRLIENAYQYGKTKREIWIRQGRNCANCGKFLPSPAFGHRHHPGGRGLGGSLMNFVLSAINLYLQAKRIHCEPVTPI